MVTSVLLIAAVRRAWCLALRGFSRALQPCVLVVCKFRPVRLVCCTNITQDSSTVVPPAAHPLIPCPHPTLLFHLHYIFWVNCSTRRSPITGMCNRSAALSGRRASRGSFRTPRRACAGLGSRIIHRFARACLFVHSFVCFVCLLVTL